MTRRGAVLGLIGALALVSAAAATLHARETRHPLAETTDRLLYLRSDRVASRLFLNFRAVAADVYWMRTIQHFGRDRKSARTDGRFELLAPLLDLTTTLDPRFNIAYRFGAIFLSLDAPDGPARPDLAIALLEKGLAQAPSRWQYAHDIGFIHYWYTGDYLQAARWFERAAEMPGAPEWIRPFAATTRAQGGDRAGARQLLATLQEAQEEYVRSAARRALLQLQALDAIDQLTALVAQYRARLGREPAGWDDLVAVGALRGRPADPAGAPFVYDAATRTVTLAADSPLRPLPPGLMSPQ